MRKKIIQNSLTLVPGTKAAQTENSTVIDIANELLTARKNGCNDKEFFLGYFKRFLPIFMGLFDNDNFSDIDYLYQNIFEDKQNHEGANLALNLFIIDLFYTGSSLDQEDGNFDVKRLLAEDGDKDAVFAKVDINTLLLIAENQNNIVSTKGQLFLTLRLNDIASRGDFSDQNLADIKLILKNLNILKHRLDKRTRGIITDNLALSLIKSDKLNVDDLLGFMTFNVYKFFIEVMLSLTKRAQANLLNKEQIELVLSTVLDEDKKDNSILNDNDRGNALADFAMTVVRNKMSINEDILSSLLTVSHRDSIEEGSTMKTLGISLELLSWK